MPLSALALVLLAALLHASWNFAAKHAGCDHRFTLITSLQTSVRWLPAGLWFGWQEAPRWGWLEWGVVTLSAAVHLLGGKLLGESDRGLRVLGAVCIAAGVMALAWG